MGPSRDDVVEPVADRISRDGCDGLVEGVTPATYLQRPLRRIEKGDPVYLCFCGIANFNNYKLGFDREFFIGSVTDEQARIYEVAIAAQQAALPIVNRSVQPALGG